MRKKIAILGSTGSIGTQTIKIIKEFADDLELVGITAYQNHKLLSQQVQEFSPKFAGIKDREHAGRIRDLGSGTTVFYGDNYIEEFIDQCECDIFVNSISGIYGLKATHQILLSGKDIALANKESIVSAGELLKSVAKRTGSRILPIDSEHSAIWQCLQGEDHDHVERLILTASGGPFFGFTRKQLEQITPKEALKHPTWKMGSKISIDSATLMNKGLEVIEASVLFDIPINKIDVLVHPQSIVHSLVEYQDGALIAQLGVPDMGQPIQYALFNKQRKKTARTSLELAKINKLTFFEPDQSTFKCLSLAYHAGRAGGVWPAVLNAANQVAVDRFLKGEIKFLQIPELISIVMSIHSNTSINDIDEIIQYQNLAKRTALNVKL